MCVKMSDEDDKDDLLREIDELLKEEVENGHTNVQVGENVDLVDNPTFGPKDLDVEDDLKSDEPLTEDTIPIVPSQAVTEYVQCIKFPKSAYFFQKLTTLKCSVIEPMTNNIIT